MAVAGRRLIRSKQLNPLHKLLNEYGWKPRWREFPQDWVWRRRDQRIRFETYDASPKPKTHPFAMRCAEIDPSLPLHPRGWVQARYYRSPLSLKRRLKQLAEEKK